MICPCTSTEIRSASENTTSKSCCTITRARINAEGSVELALDDATAITAARELERLGVGAVGVCFLWSIVNPAHELRVAQLLREQAPRVGSAAISGTDFRSGWRRHISQMTLVSHGGPASAHADGCGTHGIPAASGSTYRDSVDINEIKFPLIVDHLRIVPGSGEAGAHRGRPGPGDALPSA